MKLQALTLELGHHPGSLCPELVPQHEQALDRLREIKNQLKGFEREEKELETETYIKSRVMNTSFSGRERDKLAEYGKRLKEIQVRLREIESTRKQLLEERDRINQG